jgi:hypothetical protein
MFQGAEGRVLFVFLRRTVHAAPTYGSESHGWHVYSVDDIQNGSPKPEARGSPYSCAAVTASVDGSIVGKFLSCRSKNTVSEPWLPYRLTCPWSLSCYSQPLATSDQRNAGVKPGWLILPGISRSTPALAAGAVECVANQSEPTEPQYIFQNLRQHLAVLARVRRVDPIIRAHHRCSSRLHCVYEGP